MNTKTKKYAEMTTQELEKSLLSMKSDLYQNRFKRAAGNLDNVSLLKKSRREIARIKTQMSVLKNAKKQQNSGGELTND